MRNNKKYIRRLQLQFVLVVLGRGKASTLGLMKRDFPIVFISMNYIVLITPTKDTLLIRN